MSHSDQHHDVLPVILRARATGYVITDATLTVLETAGELPDFLGKAPIGGSILDVFPELMGNEAALSDILAGDLTDFELPLINREDDSGETYYFDLSVMTVPWAGDSPDKRLLFLWVNSSRLGIAHQNIMQQRNELTLLRNKLASQNARLHGANLELRRANELKSKFIGVAAHELRSPLASIMGYTELLQDADLGDTDAPYNRFVDQIYTSATRLLGLLNNLLDITRIEAGNLDIVLSPADLSPIIAETIDELRPQFAARRQTVRFEPPATPMIALCDSRRVRQILTNLLGNAHKYTHEDGEIAIRCRAAQSPGFIEISIRDTGIGIDEKNIDNLFATFYRADNANETAASGAGLGLSITRSLVEQHGGEIWVESLIGEGSTFYFTLPVGG